MTEDWTLQIRYPQRRDSGVYECQVGTTPPIGHSMILSVVGTYITYSFQIQYLLRRTERLYQDKNGKIEIKTQITYYNTTFCVKYFE